MEKFLQMPLSRCSIKTLYQAAGLQYGGNNNDSDSENIDSYLDMMQIQQNIAAVFYIWTTQSEVHDFPFGKIVREDLVTC